MYLAEDSDGATQDDIIRDSVFLRDGCLPLERPNEIRSYPHPFDYSSSSSQSESDESDAPLFTPPDPTNPGVTPLIVTRHSDILGPSLSRRLSDTDVLGFLPHPPSSEKPKRSKRNPKRIQSDKPLFGCALDGDGFTSPSFEGCLGGF